MAELNDVATRSIDSIVVGTAHRSLKDISAKDSTYSDLKESTQQLTDKLVSVERQLYRCSSPDAGRMAFAGRRSWPSSCSISPHPLAARTTHRPHCRKRLRRCCMKTGEVKAEVEALLKNDVPAFDELAGRSRCIR